MLMSIVQICRAKVVWRNFSVATQDIEAFRMEKISQDLGLDRSRMKLMAIFLGCDFFPSGINGVGKEKVIQLFKGWPKDWDALKILDYWRKSGFKIFVGCDGNCKKNEHCVSCISFQDCIAAPMFCLCSHLKNNPKHAKLENLIKTKCQNEDEHWWTDVFPKIMDEFESKQENISDLQQFSELGEPNFDQAMSILVNKLTWTDDYAKEKLIPFLTRWQLEQMLSGKATGKVVDLSRIVKKRVVNNVKSLQLEWIVKKDDHCKQLDKVFESIEPFDLVNEAFPDMVKQFEDSKKKPKKKEKVNDKEKVVVNPKSQITNFFKQQKIKLNSPLKKKVKQEKESKDESINLQMDDEEEEDSLMDMSNLSLIVDEIINGGKSAKPDSSSKEVHSNFVTSTPALKCTSNKRKTIAPRQPVLFNAEQNLEEVIKKDDSIDLLNMTEDSFDRMCM